MFPNIKIVEAIRKEYPAGTRVRLVKMDDIQAPPLGTKGTVVGVDDTGSLLMHWDNADTIGQYTGINDSLGNFIFEDDIITFWLKNDATRTRRKGVVEYSESSARFMVRVCESTDVVMLKDCCCIHVIGNVFDGEFDKSESEMKQLYTECLNLAKSIDAIMLCYNPDIDALKAENLSDMAVRLLDGVSRRGVVKDLEDFRDKWRHYNEQAAAESQVILDKISELFEKDGDSK